MEDQAIHECGKDRFSEPFPTLLPGMYCTPVYAVPKPHSNDLRMVMDHSAGEFSLNSMINHDSVTGFPLDNLTQLGDILIRIKSMYPNDESIIWKSDISEAYRVCPMHPAWQIKQVVEINSKFYVDRCNSFGSSASFAIFICVNALITWIAKNVRNISCIVTYVDDSSGCTFSGDVSFYKPYQKFMPSPQVRLLTLWDELGIPHKEKKQLSGLTLPVIGIDIDPNVPSFTLPNDARLRLVTELKLWSASKGFNDSLKRWQQLSGWINWALNVFPLLRPCLNRFYPKMHDKTLLKGNIYVNGAIREDFKWATEKLDTSSGIFLLKSVDWNITKATHIIYCDACPSGMGFWYPNLHLGYLADNPADDDGLIFYFEALCVLCALHDASKRSPKGRKFIIYTDNMNTVDIFNSLQCLPNFNIILKAAVDILYSGEHDMRVLHVPGTENIVADALSRGRLDVALQTDPSLKVTTFEPYR
ncbi:hypothetical protein CPB83DRAFT_791773, partial [Crepidotus variabilis]